jgi:cyclopropane-fatty-acyl-phospholipid synthase
MFEHVRNHKLLFDKMFRWLENDGQLFVHIFCHRSMTYLFEANDDSDWMSRHFFSGGIMPAFDLFEKTQTALKLKNKWSINGTHYQKTSEAWLENMKTNSKDILNLFSKIYKHDALKFYVYWQVFFMACAETFGYNAGNEWHVGHYLFERNT